MSYHAAWINLSECQLKRIFNLKAFVSDFDDDGDDEEVEDGRGSFDRALVWWSLSRSYNKRKSSDEAVLDRNLLSNGEDHWWFLSLFRSGTIQWRMIKGKSRWACGWVLDRVHYDQTRSSWENQPCLVAILMVAALVVEWAWSRIHGKNMNRHLKILNRWPN